MTAQSVTTVDIAFVPEVNWGVTPASPSMQLIERVSSSLNMKKDTFQSNRIRSDRKIAHYRHGVRKIEGDLEDEFAIASHDTFLAAALCNDWVSDVLKDGVAKKSFTFEQNFADITGDKRQVFTGVRINTTAIDLPTTGLATIKYGLIGKGMTIGNTALDATPDAPVAGSLLASVNGSLSIDGVQVALLTSLQINIDNKIEGTSVVGSNEIGVQSYGRCNISGSFEALVEDLGLVKSFRDEEEMDLVCVLEGEVAGTSLTIRLPRIKLGQADINLSGEGIAIVSTNYQALLASAENAQIIITRVNTPPAP